MPEPLFNKVVVLQSATLLKVRLRHKCFPLNFERSLRTPFLQNTSKRLLLKAQPEILKFVNMQQVNDLWFKNIKEINFDECFNKDFYTKLHSLNPSAKCVICEMTK